MWFNFLKKKEKNIGEKKTGAIDNIKAMEFLVGKTIKDIVFDSVEEDGSPKVIRLDVGGGTIIEIAGAGKDFTSGKLLANVLGSNKEVIYFEEDLNWY